MQKLMQLSMMILLLLVLSGCNEPQCPKPNLPAIYKIEKIKKKKLVFEPDGSLKTDSAQKAYKQLKAYSISEHYYFTSIDDYMEFRNEVMKDNK